MTMRKTITAIAIALLWAPATQSFVANSGVNGRTTVSPMLSAVASANDGFDQEAFDRKNQSRKKFGMKPMSPEEFIKNEIEVQKMALAQEQRAVQLEKEAATRRQNEAREQSRAPGFFDKVFGAALPDTCESNFDCEAPKVCCDFGVSKVCCSGGSKMRSREGELALVPVPVDVMMPNNKY